MKKSILYSILLIAALSLTLTLIPQASKGQAENVKIVSYTWYIDMGGQLVVVGEIQNTGQNTLETVMITGTAYTTDGTPTESPVTVWGKNLVPGQKAPFYMPFFYRSENNFYGTWPGIEVAKIDFEVTLAKPTASYQYPDLQITQKSARIDSSTENKGAYWVEGTIKNTGTQTVKGLSLVATFYNSTGHVITAGYTFEETMSATTLASSASATFKIPAFDLNQTNSPANLKIDKYSLLVQVTEPLLQGDAPVITPTPIPDPAVTDTPTQPTDSPSNTQSANQDSNTDSSTTSPPTWAYAAAGIIVVGAIAGIVLMMRKRKTQPATKTSSKPAAKPKHRK